MNYVDELYKQIRDIKEDIESIQKNCSHPVAADRAETSILHTCMLCGLQWVDDKNSISKVGQ